MDPKAHWNSVYQTKGERGVSWYQTDAELSLRFIKSVSSSRNATIVDVGGGASTLVDGLLNAGYGDVTVLDLSATGIQLARTRLGAVAQQVTWVEADVLTAELAESAFDIWHDRAVFHFLTNQRDQHRYVSQVQRAVKPGGHVIVGTFAEDGPERCSGLSVARYSAEALHGEFGTDFRLLGSERQVHITPSGVPQVFTYCVCRYCPAGIAEALKSAA